MADNTVRGRFLWRDLVTADSDAAHAFYSKVFGWKRHPWDQDPAYVMFAAPSGPLGGTMAAAAGDASHWIPYLGATDIEATRRQALELGATVVKELTDTGSGGRYLVLADPQGARFGVYGSDADPGRDTAPKPGQLHWHELATTDTRAAAQFYTALFGWDKSGEFDMGPMGVYYLFGRNGRQLGGIYDKPADQPGGPAWLGYTRVKDIHGVVKKAQSAGGRLVNGPMEVPTGDWVAMFLDPQGAAFAAVVLKDDMKPAAPKPVAIPTADISGPSAVRPKPAATRKPAARKPVAKAPARKKAAKKTARKPVAKAARKRRAAAKSAKRPARKAAKAGRKRVASKKRARKVRKAAAPRARKGK